MMDTWIWTWLTMVCDGLRIRYGGCVTWGVQYRAYGKIPFQRFIKDALRLRKSKPKYKCCSITLHKCDSLLIPVHYSGCERHHERLGPSRCHRVVR